MIPADGERWTYVRADGHLPSDKEPDPDNSVSIGDVVRLLGGVAYFPGDTAAQDTVRAWCDAYDNNPDGYIDDGPADSSVDDGDDDNVVKSPVKVPVKAPAKVPAKSTP
jgi:hypothetical protein